MARMARSRVESAKCVTDLLKWLHTLVSARQFPLLCCVLTWGADGADTTFLETRTSVVLDGAGLRRLRAGGPCRRPRGSGAAPGCAGSRLRLLHRHRVPRSGRGRHPRQLVEPEPGHQPRRLQLRQPLRGPRQHAAAQPDPADGHQGGRSQGDRLRLRLHAAGPLRFRHALQPLPRHRRPVHGPRPQPAQRHPGLCGRAPAAVHRRRRRHQGRPVHLAAGLRNPRPFDVALLLAQLHLQLFGDLQPHRFPFDDPHQSQAGLLPGCRHRQPDLDRVSRRRPERPDRRLRRLRPQQPAQRQADGARAVAHRARTELRRRPDGRQQGTCVTTTTSSSPTKPRTH